MDAAKTPASTPAAAEPGPATLILSLGIAGLVSGVVIVGIYLATLSTIRQNRADALMRAVDEVLSLDAASSAKRILVVSGGRLVTYEPPAPGMLPDEPAVYAGYDGAGALVGLAVPAETAGFQDTVALIYGFDPRRDAIVGMKVLESRETPGLGDKIIKDAGFVGQFRDLPADHELVGVKPGASAKRWEVDVISGATISSKAVLKAINLANERWRPLLAAFAREEAGS